MIRTKAKFSYIAMGLILIIAQSVSDIESIFNQLFEDEDDLREERQRRKLNRERRLSRATSSLVQKANLRKLVKLKESDLDSNWVNERIGLRKAIKNFKPQRKIVIAVIDTGVDFNNPYITSKLYKNSGEMGLDSKGRDKRTNGVDDDSNGFIDDVSGWDFAGKDALPQDIQGHGTHITGIILKDLEQYDSIEILPLRFFDETATDDKNIRASVRAFKYAISQGVDIINYSAGGSRPSDLERAVLNQTEENSILLVAAAGNQGLNIDKHPYYPAGYRNRNIISVAGVDKNNRKVASSNYGRSSVDVYAPGKSISSLGLNDTKRVLTGTSQATAFVTKVLAMKMASLKKKTTPAELKEHLMANAKTEGRLNTYQREAKVMDAASVINRPLRARTKASVLVSDI